MRIIATLLALGFVACSGIQVSTDFDPQVDFSTKRSFAWLDDRSGVEGDRADVSSLLDRRIRGAIENELLAKGLAASQRDYADLLVSYHLGVEQKLDVNTIYTGYGYGSGWYGYGGYGGGRAETYVTEYDEGTLLIDFIDPAKKELVWRGSGQARVRASSSPEEREKRVREAVSTVLKGFPPKQK